MTTSSKFFLAVIAVGVALTAASIGALQLVGLFACGQTLGISHPLAGLLVPLTGDLSMVTIPTDCTYPADTARVACIVAIALIAAALIAATFIYSAYRQSDAFFIRDVKNRSGFANGWEIRKHMSAAAVLARAPQLRPGLKTTAATDVGWRIGRARGQDVYISIEDSVVVVGPPRMGKGYRVLISAIIDWAGPLVTTSTTNDNLTATLQMRRKRGQTWVFDPQGLSGVRDRARISPIAGCEDPQVADQRGRAIVTGTALGSSSSNQEWAQASGVVLARLLHAAAVSGGTVEDLYAWGSNPRMARAAVDILRSDGTPGWGDGLEAILAGDEKLLSSTWFGVQGAVAPLAIPQIRDTLTPARGDLTFDPHEFLEGEHSLYLVGSATGASAMGGFLAALLNDTVEVARTKALASPGSRLQQPLGLILDEIVNMFRWAELPRIMADGGGRGICAMVVLQALSQAESGWSAAEASTIWSAGTAKILLGGGSDVDDLRDIEALLGTRELQRTQRSWSTHQAGVSTSEQRERMAVLSADEIRRLPESLGLLAYRNRRGVLLDLQGWTARSDRADIIAGKSTTAAEQQAVFADRYARRRSQ